MSTSKPATVEFGMIGRKTKFSLKQRREIERRITDGQRWHPIARAMRIPYEAVRRQFDEDYRLKRNAGVQSRREGITRRIGPGLPGKFERHVETPAFVLEERTRRVGLSRPSLTAEFCGDPLPGYSALDRMGRS